VQIGLGLINEPVIVPSAVLATAPAFSNWQNKRGATPAMRVFRIQIE
jgi:hypothetical protein